MSHRLPLHLVAAATQDLAVVIVLAAFFILIGWWFAYSTMRKRRRQAQRLDELRRNWGQPVERERDFACFRSAFARHCNQSQCIDEQTWTDMDLDSVFAYIDRTFSSPGEIELYRVLRYPRTDRPALEERKKLINVLQSRPDVCEHISVELQRLGRTPHANGLIELLWDEHPSPDWRAPLYTAIAILAAVSVVVTMTLAATGARWELFGLVTIGPLFALNLFIHYRTRRRVAERLLSLRYLSRLVISGRRIALLGSPGLEQIMTTLGRQAAATAAIPRNTSLLLPEHSGTIELVDVIQEYLSIFLLIEVRAYYRTLERIQKCRDDLRGLFESLGMLDALQSAASFRQSLPFYVVPEFESLNRALHVTDIVHPLVKDAVPNSITLDRKGCLITGANMSGKSTFLRTLGVGAILAQTLVTCPARKYHASLFHIITALATRDDLVRGKSYYLVEAERLLEMIQCSESTVCNLCLVDEILRGTNTAERLAASEEILGYLSEKNCLVIAATHDVELVAELACSYDSYHFDAKIDANGIHVDHMLHPGPSCERNAINLLRLLQYPEAIVENASRRLKAMQQQ